MNVSKTPAETSVRELRSRDLDAVVELDRRIMGSSRRAYFERRLAAAKADPGGHLQLAATSSDGGVHGFALGRLAGGEFGRGGRSLLLEAIGVEPALHGMGVGSRLMASLAERAPSDVARVATQADWRDHAMLSFLDRAGFELSPRLVLERPVHRMPLPDTDEEIERTPPLVRHLRAGDLAMLTRIDGLITGEDRSAYLARKVEAALHESAIVVSLVVEDDGFVVAFAMARVDLGDFGRVAPTASLDTLGVNPGFAGRGLARALLGQLIDNLAALHVETLETEVERESFDLLRFLYRFGFGASSRLAFTRPVAHVAGTRARG